jgi:hypothetical protein
MADVEKLGLTESDSGDDSPEASNLAPWQQFLRKWQSLIAFGPFAIFIFVALKFFGNSPSNWLFLIFAFVTVIWAVAFAGYALYLKYLE